MQYYTLVQHSAFGWKGDPTFEHAVESRILETHKEVTLVAKAGGFVFNGYNDADRAEYSENYDSLDAAARAVGDVNGIIPRAPGTFSDKMIDGLRIYVRAKI